MRPRTGADPNRLVSVTDDLGATTLPAGESSRTVVPAAYDQVCAAYRSRRARTGTAAPNGRAGPELIAVPVS